MANDIHFLDKNGLLYVWQKIKTILANKVDVVSGKGLSTNDFTNELQTKLTNLPSTAAENIIEAVKVNGSALTITSKSVDVAVPTNNNQLTNGAGYQTASDVSTAINTALADITGIEFEIVNALPATGRTGTIYLLSNSGTGQNIYDEYVWIDSAFEKIGTTDIDLSGYVQKTETITNAEIDAIIAS